MFIVAIIPLMFSPGIDGGECKSIRFSVEAAVFSFAVDRPEAPGEVESWSVGALLLADVGKDGVEEPASVGAIESEVPDVLLQFLRPLLGWSAMQSGE